MLASETATDITIWVSKTLRQIGQLGLSESLKTIKAIASYTCGAQKCTRLAASIRTAIAVNLAGPVSSQRTEAT